MSARHDRCARLHLIAGPNGAGKSTLFRYLVQPRYPELPFINADLHERDHLSQLRDPVVRSEAARAWADSTRQQKLDEGRSFISETVFSHPSKLDLLREARARGFEIALYLVCLDEPACLLRRVEQRVMEGGHDVPPAKILERYPRTVANLREAVRISDLAMLFDAEEVEVGGPRLVATVSHGTVRLITVHQPRWAREVLASVATTP